MKRETREVWAQRVGRWRDSGLTCREFAAEIGVNANSLSNWAWRLRAKPGRAAASTTAARAPSRPTGAGMGWVEVVTPPADEAAAGGSGFELVLGRERMVRVPANFDAHALRRLLAVVEAS